MKKTLGNKMNELRKQHGMTQDEIAEKMGVSSQAVSKWENDLSIPDLSILIQLADFYHISLDELVREKEETVHLVAKEDRKNINDMLLRAHINTTAGDKIKVNLPLALIKIAADMNVELPEFNGSEILKQIDFHMVIALIENGVMGTLVEVNTADGDIIEITVE